MTPKIISYLYTGTNKDGVCVLGVLAAINADGTAELWSREPNLGTVVHIVKADTLEIACPIHALPRPETKEEYNTKICKAWEDFRKSGDISSSDDLRRLASCANYLADLVEFVDYGDLALTASGREADASTSAVDGTCRSADGVANAERQSDTLTEAADCSASPREVEP